MNIAILAAGAGGMYCGSCMRDNALAMALKRLGHSVTLIPLYSPLRSEQPQDATVSQVFYGGINVYLQHIGRLFRHTPRVFDWIFDRPWILNAATDIGAQTSPRKLAGLTMSVLAGEEGAANKELTRLLDFLKQEIEPQVVLLPNAMFVGMARTFTRELGVPVVCELTGEDIFLDAMNDADRIEVRDAIRKRAADVTRFVATSGYYAGRMAEYLDVPRERVDVVSSGISGEYLTPIAQPSAPRPPTIGYLARICPEKGLDRLVDALEILLRMPDLAGMQLKAAGYLGNRDKKWFAKLRQRIESAGLNRAFTYLGEVDLPAKLTMLDSIDVFSVPTAYAESKGIYILEAMARGVPVVQPAHGSFPELIKQTGGGVLVPPGDAVALADTLAKMLRDREAAREIGTKGRAAIESSFTDDHMAQNMLAVFDGVTQSSQGVPVR
ncbi:MAG TPA: glycosyltransferase family 4 protein [Humisphaera sp.]|jgi:glycosyltransferase involved in cell wall biosynthesis|nr:glycosyltransferase family 4 protein [Humisphaera sp.]